MICRSHKHLVTIFFAAACLMGAATLALAQTVGGNKGHNAGNMGSQLGMTGGNKEAV
jgi:hypothetical protein